jgi:Ala-tRNA(Pro) deacylase
VTAARASVYSEMMRLFKAGGVHFRIIDHPAEGRTEAASALRGHCLAAAAKSLVVRVRKTRRAHEDELVLAVVPGDRRVDFGKLVRVVGGRTAGLAPLEQAEQVAGCASGSIPPISFHPDLRVILDRGLLTCAELYFNAARLDRSVALTTEDYLSLVRPQVEDIAADA